MKQAVANPLSGKCIFNGTLEFPKGGSKFHFVDPQVAKKDIVVHITISADKKFNGDVKIKP